jgi:hypothetical protein
MTHFKKTMAVLTLTVLTTTARAAGFPVQARLFASATKVDPSALNAEMTSEGLMNYSYFTAVGVEMTYPMGRLLDVGLRYTKHWQQLDEKPITTATEYYGKMDQDTVSAVLRIPVMRRGMLKFDVFGAIGGTNSTFTMKTATVDGSLKKSNSGDYWVATPYYAAGSSVGIGFKKFYIFAEAGYENNRVNNFTSQGTIADIGTIDMSGPYLLVGVLFDGVTATKQ